MRYIRLMGLGALFVATQASASPIQIGDVLASIGFGQVQDYSSTGTLRQTLNDGSGSQFTTGSTTDVAGNFYVTNFSTGTVSKFNSNAVFVGNVASGYSSPESILFSAKGTGYVGQAGAPFIGTIGGSPVGPLTTEERGTDWITLNPNQTTFLYTSEGHNVLQFDKLRGQLANFNVAPLPGSNAFALKLLSNGNLLVADSSAVLLLNSSGSTIKTYTYGTDRGLFSLDINPNQSSFWTGSFATGNIYETNIATGASLNTISTRSSSLFGVSVYGEFQSGGGGVGATPLPAALPLFAAGLGALGLLCWRKKRKNAITASA
jgi:hypothetical protein